jgi:hypothetical protein
VTPAAAGEVNTASNVGLAGISVVDSPSKVGVDLKFRSIAAGTSKISVTHDDPNNAVDIDVVEANVNHNNLSGASGTYTHATIDGHIDAVNNPHDTTLLNLDDTNLAGIVQGCILYRNATEWVVLTPGTSGQILQTQGAAANPQWVTGGGGTVTGTGTDNHIARWNGTSDIQDSNLIIDDNGNLILEASDEIRWGSKRGLLYASEILHIGRAGGGTNAIDTVREQADVSWQVWLGDPTPAQRLGITTSAADFAVDVDLNDNDLFKVNKATFNDTYTITPSAGTASVNPDNGNKQQVTFTSTTPTLNFITPTGGGVCNMMLRVTLAASTTSVTLQHDGAAVDVWAAGASLDMKNDGTTLLGVYFDGSDVYLTSSPDVQASATVNLT